MACMKTINTVFYSRIKPILHLIAFTNLSKEPSVPAFNLTWNDLLKIQSENLRYRKLLWLQYIN